MSDQPNILIAHPSLPAISLGEFIALARSQPGKLTYGSAGNGSGTHLAMELLLMSQRMELVHVPFKGTGPALTASPRGWQQPSQPTPSCAAYTGMPNRSHASR